MHVATDQPPAPDSRPPARPSETAAHGTGDPFAYAVLGPVRVSRHGERVDPGSPQQRAVLVALLLREGRRASVDELIDALWGCAPPRSAAQTIRTYVHRLRRVLGPVSPADASPLVSDDHGYALRASPDRLDLQTFRRRVAGAEAAADQGDHAAAVTGFRDALTLWHGEALAGIPGEYAAAQRAALEAARLSAVEKRIRSEWELGRHGESTGELAGMVAAHPLDERYLEMLMLALSRSGRRAQALEAYREARAHLVSELGVEPGARLRRLHERILAADPALSAPAALPVKSGRSAREPGGTGPVAPVPDGLPADPPSFIGRQHELATLDALLTEQETASGTAIVVIAGMAGVGKTSLAVHWAHRTAHRFPDGRLHLDLRGFDPSGPAVSASDALGSLLQCLGVSPARLPADPAARTALWRTLLGGRRVLLLLDNARDAEQIRPLLPGGPGPLVLVTSRHQLSGLTALEGARPLRIDTLDAARSTAFLVRRIGEARAAAEPGAVDDIAARCGGLPLALAVVAARAVCNPEFRLGRLADELRDAQGSLDAFTDADPSADARAVFSCSYRVLTPPAARLFRLLSAHPGTFGVSAAAALADATTEETRGRLVELVRAHLLQEPAPGRYAFHDLLRVHASELSRATDTPARRDAAVRRMLDHYVHAGFAACRTLFPHRRPVGPCVPLAESPVTAPPDRDRALAWFTAEQHALTELTARAAQLGEDTRAWQLAWVCKHFFYLTGMRHPLLAAQRLALEAARRLGDPVALAHTHLTLVRAEAQLGRRDAAHDHAAQALRIFTEAGDAAACAETHREASWVRELEGDMDAALAHARKALALVEAGGDRLRHGLALNAVGWYHARLGQEEEALDHCRRALRELEAVGDAEAQADVWDTLGYAHQRLGRHREAARCYERTLDLHRRVRAGHAEAGTLIRLGDVRLALGEEEEAGTAWRRALGILDELGPPHGAERQETLDRLSRLH
ncbi:AfsR/SARP family transcriptional regulator [Streptomyces althioticus]|uniref:AfsR/SARP family transcriptional regulator n=1 Tax=Streptomyces althioticus TaxID=83380 RepID=UPI0033C3222B